MEYPKDYVIEMVRQTLDEKINQLCDTQEAMRLDLKNDILELKFDLKEEIQDIKSCVTDTNKSCITNMSDHDKRITNLEHVKYKIYAWTAAIGTTAAFLFNYFFKSHNN